MIIITYIVIVVALVQVKLLVMNTKNLTIPYNLYVSEANPFDTQRLAQ